VPAKERKVKTTIEVDLKWFTFRQNNSGGSFAVDDQVAEVVCIQARNASEAIRKAEEVCGPSGEDWCGCCGERWSYWISDEDGTDGPTLYGEPIHAASGWCVGDGVRLHHFDGSVTETEIRRTA
jgi:hypothetical protein